MSTRQTLRDFLTSIGSTSVAISLPINPGSDGIIDQGDDLGVEPGTGKPLLNFDTGKSLLGDYASFISADNEYPLSPGAHESIGGDRGESLQRAEDSSASQVFARSSDRDNAESLNRSNSTIFDSAGYRLNTIIDKTGDGSATSGNDLLPEVIGVESNSDSTTDQSNAVVASFASLRKYNRFSPTSDPSSFARDNDGNTITAQQYTDTRTINVQTGEGVYESQVVEVSAEVDQEILSKIARSTILKATGWDESTLVIDAKDPDRAFNGISNSTLSKFPSILRQNQGLVEPFRAQDAHGMPQSADGSSLLGNRGDAVQKSLDESVYMRTRGSMYAPDLKFGENPNNRILSARLQSLQAGIAMVGLASVIESKLVNYDQYVSELQIKEDSVLRGPYYPGKSLKSKVSVKTRALVRSFMFQTGVYSFKSCISEGFYACLGFQSFSVTGDPRNLPVAVDTDSIVQVPAYKQYIENIAKDLGGDSDSFLKTSMGLSQGFWRAVSESALRTISRLQTSASELDGSDFASCILNMKDSIAFKIMNVFASIGYQRLVIQGGVSTAQKEAGEIPKNPYDMDSYPTTPGTRQMKSRDGKIRSSASLVWRNSALPSAFILPVEAMAHSLDMDYMFDTEKGSNPIKGMLGSTMYDKTYVKTVRNSNSIPSSVTKFIEDRLGAEYMPFYFRDLRTNEIVAFHAFLDSLSDGYSANYSDTKTYGRADGVQNYSSTTRTIGGSFWIVATSREDFDEMWFKINKLTTLVYPQYTRGRTVSQKDTSTLLGNPIDQTVYFEQPFSQLVGGTPVIRLRIGDLIKSNYTRSNFAKLFGVGNDTFSANFNADNVLVDNALAFAGGSLGGAIKSVGSFDIRLLPFLLYAGSPMELSLAANAIPTGGWSGAARAAVDAALESASYLLRNGFVNPLLAGDRDSYIRNNGIDQLNDSTNDFSNNAIENFLTSTGLSSKAMLKSRSTPYQISDENNPDSASLLRLRRPVFVKIKSSKVDRRLGTVLTVSIDDSTIGEDLNGKTCNVSAADLFIDSGQIVDIGSYPGVLLGAGLVTGLVGATAAAANNGTNTAIAGNTQFDAPVDIPLADLIGSLGRTFTSPYNNPITKAFEDRMGEGLAGVVKQMSFTWMDVPWETDWNSRAPMACKIQFSFTPIHDISPGIDSNGFNRAPLYNVGQIMHDSFGHARSDGGAASRYFFKKSGATAENARSPDEYSEFSDNLAVKFR